MTNNYILGNIEKKSKVDIELYKKLNEEYSRTDLENNIEKKSVLEKNSSNNNSLAQKVILDSDDIIRVHLNLKKLHNVVVHTYTQEEYDTLMQIYETAGWKWCSGSQLLTTEYDNAWLSNHQDTCVEAKDGFFSGSFSLFDINLNRKIISIQDFYTEQGITSDIIKKINTWYDINKPDRKSKG